MSVISTVDRVRSDPGVLDDELERVGDDAR